MFNSIKELQQNCHRYHWVEASATFAQKPVPLQKLPPRCVEFNPHFGYEFEDGFSLPHADIGAILFGDNLDEEVRVVQFVHKYTPLLITYYLKPIHFELVDGSGRIVMTSSDRKLLNGAVAENPGHLVRIADGPVTPLTTLEAQSAPN